MREDVVRTLHLVKHPTNGFDILNDFGAAHRVYDTHLARSVKSAGAGLASIHKGYSCIFNRLYKGIGIEIRIGIGIEGGPPNQEPAGLSAGGAAKRFQKIPPS